MIPTSPSSLARNVVALRPDRPGPEERWSLGLLVEIVRRHLTVIALITAATLALALAYLVVTPPSFTARVQLVLDTKRAQPFPSEAAPEGLVDAGLVESQGEMIKAEKVALAVVRSQHLDQDPEFVGTGPGMLSRAWGAVLRAVGLADEPDRRSVEDVRRRVAVDALGRALKVMRVGRSYLADIQVTTLDPEKSARIANEVASAYIQDQFDAKLGNVQKAGSWMQDRIGELRAQAGGAYSAVEDFKSANNIIVDATGKLASERELEELSSSLARARSETSQARARLDRINAILRGAETPGGADLPDAAVTDALNNTIITRLRQQYLDTVQQGNELTARYGANHVAAVNLRAEGAGLQRSIWNEVRRIGETYKSEFEIARAREDAGEKRLTEVFQQTAATRQAQVKLRELESAAQTYRSIFETFLTRYTQTLQQQSFPVTEARVVTEATPPLSKSSPKTGATLLLATLAGLGLGFAAAFTRENLDRVIRRRDQLERGLGVRSLGFLPLVERGRSRLRFRRAAHQADAPVPAGGANLLLHLKDDHPGSATGETLRGLKVAIDQSGRPSGGHVLGLVSAQAGEGRTTLAFNLAAMLAETGRRTLLVDADLRNPVLSRILAPEVRDGLLDVLNGRTPLAAAVVAQEFTPGFGFDLLGTPPGRAPAHPADALNSAAMKDLLAGACKTYDYVILDLPPMLRHVDVRAAAGLLDAFVLVVEWGRTTLDEVEQALGSAPVVAERLLGAVINKSGGAGMRRDVERALASSSFVAERLLRATVSRARVVDLRRRP